MSDAVHSNFDLICQEYPFILNLPGARKSVSAYVTRFDTKDINNVPYRRDHPDGGTVDVGRFFLLATDGEIISEVGARSWFKVWTRDETLRSAIKRIGDKAENVIYGVVVENGGTVGIYKMPRGINNAHTWIAKADKESLSKIRALD